MKESKNQLKIGIILNYINIGIGNIIPILYTPIMLDLLGQAEYGLYKLSANITSYLSLISLGIGAAVTRYLIKAKIESGKEAEEKVLGLFMVIFQVIAIVSFVVGMILSWNLHIWYGDALTSIELSRMKVLTLLLVCNTALSFSVSPYISVVSANEKFVFLQCMNIISTCLGPILNLIVLFLGYKSIGMAISTLGLGVISRFAYIYYVVKVMGIKAKYKNIPFHLLKEILGFSFWIFVANIVGQLYNATDTVMIGAIPGLAASGVAIYNIGATFNHIVLSVTTGVSNLLGPKTNKMVFSGASNKELTDLAIKVGRLQGYIITLVVTGFIAFGQPFIYYYAGEGYEESYWVAVLVMIPNMIPLVQSVCLSIIVAQNKHKFRSIVYLGIAILNVIGTWAVLPHWGIIGAAIVTSISVIVGQGGVMNWYYWKKTGLDMIRFWKELGKIYIFPGILCIVSLLVSRKVDFYNFGIMVMGIICYTGLCLIGNWSWIMNSYEKALFMEPLNKVKRRIKNFNSKK